MQIVLSVADKFNDIEPKLYDSVQKSMAEIGKKLQKAIDTLVSDNIYKLKLVTKKNETARSNSFIRSGKKKKTKTKNKRRHSIVSSNSEVRFKPAQSIDQFQNLFQMNTDLGKISLLKSIIL